MTLDGKILIDYATLIANPTIFKELENCMVLLPYSSLDIIFNDLESEKINPTEDYMQKALRELGPFVDNLYTYPHILNQVLEEEKKISDSICINKAKNIHFALTGIYTENKHNLPDKIWLDDCMFDMISASIEFDCPIFTDNYDIVDAAKEFKLPIDIITR